jgi:hypothetical protein
MGTQMSLKRAAELCAQTFTLDLQDGSTETIWIRTLTALEREEATEAHANLRQEIRRKYAEGTARREALVGELEVLDSSSLIGIILQSEWRDIAQRARRSLPALMPPDLSNYRTEEKREQARERYEKAQEEQTASIGAAIDELTAKRETELAERSREEILAKALKLAIEIAIANDAFGIEDDYKIFYGVYAGDDHDERYFEDIETVRSLPDSVKHAFRQAAREVDNVEPVDIKNSRGRSVTLTGPAESIPDATKVRSTKNSPESGLPKKRSRGGRKR